ncbi:hypothetical protein C1O66_21740 [Paucibacter aquatile]|uniref:Uncharacterized protein n=1 Tax=Kinneretia aquatilis TaxID=2070761 RepID=A0A2N8KS84_9BURK|nr:hypothetical protein [Paucibacter aquatile]PND36328.1 hypothetical protein C1O66_21740 [Paucibacter aquatile]
MKKKMMMMKLVVCGLATCGFLSAQAVQPVDAGLQPLHERLSALAQDQKRLDEQLSREDGSAEARAHAWRRSKALAAERAQLERDIALARLRAQSPLLMHASPSPSESSPASQAPANP